MKDFLIITSAPDYKLNQNLIDEKELSKWALGRPEITRRVENFINKSQPGDTLGLDLLIIVRVG